MEVARYRLWASVLCGKHVELYKPINLLLSSPPPVAPDENSSTQQQRSEGTTNR